VAASDMEQAIGSATGFAQEEQERVAMLLIF